MKGLAAIALTLVRMMLGFIFVYAGYIKWISPVPFASSIAAYHILPDFAINVVAIGLPPFEVASGLLLCLGFHVRTGALATALMLIVFMGAIVITLFRGIHLDCGCFGSAAGLWSNPWINMVRDLLLLALAVICYRRAFTSSATGLVAK